MLTAFAVSLGLTLLIELDAALVYGVRSRFDLLITCLVNVITNPLAVLAYLLLRRYTGLGPWAIKLPVEALVLLSETLLFRRYAETVKKPLLYAAVLNTASFLIGEVINRLN
ncbi:MAG: hypothetical protein IKE57_05475 [Oscillospiraceae bacterium]|nr:hypothetical protein [Oscillospiraceae bacterium]